MSWRCMRLLLVAAAVSGGCRGRSPETDREPATTASPAVAVDTAPAGPQNAFPPVTFQGFGPVRYGMTAAEAQAAAGGRLKLPTAPEGCDYARPVEAPDAYGFMVENGRIVRLDIHAPAIRTAEGAGIGDDEARVQALYPGHVRVQPHKYTEGHYLIVASPADSMLELVFETEKNVVTTYRAGLRPAVEYVEGCS